LSQASGSDKEETVWVIRARDSASGKDMSLITRSIGEQDKDNLYPIEKLLAVKVDGEARWLWVKNPERTSVFGNFLLKNFILKERRKATPEELVAIKLSANGYEIKGKFR